MAHYLIFAASYAFAVTVQPGPLLTYIVSRALTQGWKRTLPTAFAPVLSDTPIIAVVLLVLSRLPQGWDHYLQLAGGVFLLFLAWRAARTFREAPSERPEAPMSGMKSLFSAAAVNLLNPGPYLGWSLVMGPLLMPGLAGIPRPRHRPSGSSFYGTMVLTLAGIIVLFLRPPPRPAGQPGAHRRFRPRCPPVPPSTVPRPGTLGLTG